MTIWVMSRSDTTFFSEKVNTRLCELFYEIHCSVAKLNCSKIEILFHPLPTLPVYVRDSRDKKITLRIQLQRLVLLNKNWVSSPKWEGLLVTLVQ